MAAGQHGNGAVAKACAMSGGIDAARETGDDMYS
jgi:hypothetical protein